MFVVLTFCNKYSIGEVILACRSLKKCEDAKVRMKTNNVPNVDKAAKCFLLDLNSLKSVSNFIGDLKKHYVAGTTNNNKKIASLINNAGIMYPPFHLSEDKIESTIGTNHLGHVYLTLNVLDLLENDASIVLVSSCGHLGVLEANSVIDLKYWKQEQYYNRVVHYSISKLMNILFAKELKYVPPDNHRFFFRGITLNVK